MAHIIHIPVSFEWRPQRAVWRVVQGQVTGLALASAKRKLHWQAEVEERGTRYLLEVPWLALPQGAEHALKLVQERRDSELLGDPVELLVCSPETHKQGGKKREADPWAMRKEFLGLKRDTKALLAFLNRWGAWGQTRTSLPAMPELRASYEGHQRLGVPHVNLDPKKLQAALDGAMSAGLVGANGDALNYLFPFELWAFRKNCGDALMKESHEWLTTQKLLALMPRQKYPHYVLNAVSSQRAISDTITIDLLRKVEFRRCSRHDCPRVFAVESLHRREYCCQYCAHLESVRKQRLEAKKLRGKK